VNLSSALLLEILVVALVLGFGAVCWSVLRLAHMLTVAEGGLELIREGIGALVAQLRENSAPTKVLERMDAVEAEQRTCIAIAQDALARSKQLGARAAARARWDRDEDEDEDLSPEQFAEAQAQLVAALGRGGHVTKGMDGIVVPDRSLERDSLKRRAFALRRRLGE